MAYDLIIRHGTIVDGSGLPRYIALACDIMIAAAKLNRTTGAGSSSRISRVARFARVR